MSKIKALYDLLTFRRFSAIVFYVPLHNVIRKNEIEIWYLNFLWLIYQRP